MKLSSITGFALAFTGILALQPSLQAQKKPETPADKVSYAIGVDMGTGMKRPELGLNPELIAQGLKDAFAGNPVMTPEEMKETLTQFQNEMQEKMKAKLKELAEKNKAASEKFLAENKSKEGVKTTASGLQYKVLKAGNGPKPKTTDTVSVNYQGNLTDGTPFDKSREPVTFPLDGIIPGWQEALQLMPVGSKWQLFIPPSLAYGENAPPQIGPNQVLVFEVELLEIKKPEAEKK